MRWVGVDGHHDIAAGQAVLVQAGSFANIEHVASARLLRLAFEVDQTIISENNIGQNDAYWQSHLKTYAIKGPRSSLVQQLLTRIQDWQTGDGVLVLPVLFLALLEQLQEQSEHVVATAAEQRYVAACAYIREHLSEPIGRDQVAAEVGCSPAYLSRTFTAHAGRSFQDQVRAWRLEQACHLLRLPHASISDVAAAVGFGSGNYLAQVFKADLGCTPSQWLASQRAGSG